MDSVVLLDTIGNQCIVKMPKTMFGRFFAGKDDLSTNPTSSKQPKQTKYHLLQQAYQDAIQAPGYTSFEDFFTYLKS